MQAANSDGDDRLHSFRSPALVVGHPGHELRVFGWMCRSRPRVYVVTDGSGRSHVSRLASTACLLDRAGAGRGEVFGVVSDAEVYRAILDGRTSLFLDILESLSTALVNNEIDCVAGDASEGFNPTHDLCRAMLNAAIVLAERATGKRIANYEFCLTEWEQNCVAPHDSRCVHLWLEEELLNRKLEAAESYSELRDEVQKAVAQKGKEYFRTECLRKVPEVPAEQPSVHKPFYETWGERRVGESEYERVIRYREHVRPIITAIRGRAAGLARATASGRVSPSHPTNESSQHAPLQRAKNPTAELGPA
jgi:hypothetical protein